MDKFYASIKVFIQRFDPPDQFITVYGSVGKNPKLRADIPIAIPASRFDIILPAIAYAQPV